MNETEQLKKAEENKDKASKYAASIADFSNKFINKELSVLEKLDESRAHLNDLIITKRQTLKTKKVLQTALKELDKHPKIAKTQKKLNNIQKILSNLEFAPKFFLKRIESFQEKIQHNLDIMLEGNAKATKAHKTFMTAQENHKQRNDELNLKCKPIKSSLNKVKRDSNKLDFSMLKVSLNLVKKIPDADYMNAINNNPDVVIPLAIAAENNSKISAEVKVSLQEIKKIFDAKNENELSNAAETLNKREPLTVQEIKLINKEVEVMMRKGFAKYGIPQTMEEAKANAEKILSDPEFTPKNTALKVSDTEPIRPSHSPHQNSSGRQL